MFAKEYSKDEVVVDDDVDDKANNFFVKNNESREGKNRVDSKRKNSFGAARRCSLLSSS